MKRFYWGCQRTPGHGLYIFEDGVSRYQDQDKQPWGTSIDSSRWTKRTNGRFHIERLDGWTGIGCDDRTVDSRGGSISVFIFEGDYSDEEVAALAREHYPKTVKRLGGIELDKEGKPR